MTVGIYRCIPLASLSLSLSLPFFPPFLRLIRVSGTSEHKVHANFLKETSAVLFRLVCPRPAGPGGCCLFWRGRRILNSKRIKFDAGPRDFRGPGRHTPFLASLRRRFKRLPRWLRASVTRLFCSLFPRTNVGLEGRLVFEFGTVLRAEWTVA